MNSSGIKAIFSSAAVLWPTAILSVLIAVSIGHIDITLKQVFDAVLGCELGLGSCDPSTVVNQIILEIRLPRILIAFISGAALALSGAVLQTITRNPLADPYLFGISAGASLGAVLVLSLTVVGLSLSMGAMLGSLLAVALILGFAGRFAGQIESLVLAGVAVSFMLSSFTSIALYHSDPNVVASMLFWMMGSFDHIGWHDLALPTVALVIAFAVFMAVHRWMTALLAGDELSTSLGINAKALRITLLVITALLTAVLVSKVGGIGFVGLMIPHISRMLIGHQLNHLLPGCVVIGGIFMVWADVIARTLLTDQQLPIGIITAAIGSLFFIILLKRQQYHSRSI